MIASSSPRTTVLAAVLAVAIAGPALADMTYSAADKAAIRAYTLRADKLAKYISATQAIKRDRRTNKALAAEMSHEGDAKTLADLHAAARRHPLSMAYYTRAGLTEDDTILMPVVMSDAMLQGMSPAVAAAYPATPAQIAFTKVHAAEMKQMDDD